MDDTTLRRRLTDVLQSEQPGRLVGGGELLIAMKQKAATHVAIRLRERRCDIGRREVVRKES